MARLTAQPVAQLAGVQRDAFDAWIAGMTIVEDHEDGPGFAAWIAEHATTAGDVTWAFIDDGGSIVATASLVRIDRELVAPADGWVLAGVNVARARRGQGNGAAVVVWILGEMRRRAVEVQRPLVVRLQADDPTAIRLYRRHGFVADDAHPMVYWLLVTPERHNHDDADR